MPTEKLNSLIQRANESLIRIEVAKVVGNLTRLIRTAIADLNARIDARLATIKDGERGPKGDKGDSIVGPRGLKGDKGDKGDQGEQGLPGKDADPNEIAKLTLPQLIAEIDKRVPLLGDSLKAGLENHVKDAMKQSFAGYGPGGGTSFSIMQSGALKVQQPNSLNFKGAGAPTVTIGSNGVTHLDFPSGGGFTSLTATETPNGVLTVFTFASATAQPSFIISDNVMLKAVTKAGTVNWTWSAINKQSTMTIPPNDDIVGIV